MHRMSIGIVMFVIMVGLGSSAQAGLVAHYPFNCSYEDASGNGHHGTPNGGVSFAEDCAGAACGAADFNGTDCWVEVPSHPDLEPSQLTIMCWFRSRTLTDPSGADTFARKRYATGGNSYEFGVQTLGELPGRIFMQINGGEAPGEFLLLSPGAVGLDEWHHVAATYDRSVVRLYLDGSLVAEQAYTEPISYDQRNLEMGGVSYAHGHIHFMDGNLDEMRIYDSALDGTEIRRLALCSPQYRLFLADGGSLNGQVIDGTSHEVALDAGTSLTGTIRLRAENDNCGGAIVPVEYAWGWGDHAVSWASVTGDVPCGGADYEVPVNLTAPTVPGTYYIVFGELGQYSGGFISSMTFWGCGSPVWNDGNDLADLDEGEMNGAFENGWVPLPGLDCPDGYRTWPTGLTYVKVNVRMPQYRLLLTEGGSINEQPVGGAIHEINVGWNWPLEGMIKLHAENDNCGGAVVPVEYAWSWGDHATSWATVTGQVPCGGADYDVPIQLTSPSVDGTYYIVFAELGQYGGGFISSMTFWGCGYCEWNDGNDLADLDEAEMSGAFENGWVPLPGLDCPAGYNLWPTGLTYVKVNVAHLPSDVADGGLAPNTDLAVWPNPSNGRIEIHLPSGLSGSGLLELADVSGRIVWQRTVETSAGVSSVTWDGDDPSGQPVSAGTYYLRLDTTDGRTRTTPIVLVR